MSGAGGKSFGGPQIGGGPAPIQQPDIYQRMGGQPNVDSDPNLNGYQPPTQSPMQPKGSIGMPIEQPSPSVLPPLPPGVINGGGKGGFGGPGGRVKYLGDTAANIVGQQTGIPVGGSGLFGSILGNMGTNFGNAFDRNSPGQIAGGPAPINIDPNAPSPLGPEGQQPVTPQMPGGTPGGKSAGGKSGFAPVASPAVMPSQQTQQFADSISNNSNGIKF